MSIDARCELCPARSASLVDKSERIDRLIERVRQLRRREDRIRELVTGHLAGTERDRDIFTAIKDTLNN